MTTNINEGFTVGGPLLNLGAQSVETSSDSLGSSVDSITRVFQSAHRSESASPVSNSEEISLAVETPAPVQKRVSFESTLKINHFDPSSEPSRVLAAVTVARVSFDPGKTVQKICVPESRIGNLEQGISQSLEQGIDSRLYQQGSYKKPPSYGGIKVLTEKGNYIQAQKDIEKIQDIDVSRRCQIEMKNAMTDMKEKALPLIKQGKFAEVQELINKMIDGPQKESTQLELNTALNLARMNETEYSHEVLHLIAQEEFAKAQALIGKMAIGPLKEAIQSELTRSIQEHPTLISTLIQEGKLVEAKELIDGMPKESVIARNLANDLTIALNNRRYEISIHIENRAFAEAERLLDQMPRGVPQRREVSLQLADVYLKTKQEALLVRVETLLKEIADVEPWIIDDNEYKKMQIALTRSFIDARNLPKAEESARAIIDPATRSALLRDVARLCERMGHIDKAERILGIKRSNWRVLDWFFRWWKLR